MPWEEVLQMDNRKSFTLLIESGESTMKEACGRYGISRKTGYKWLKRYRENQVEDFLDRSRRPHSNPNKTPGYWIRRILEQRQERRCRYGAKKIWVKLQESKWDSPVPSITTIQRILERAGLTQKRLRRSKKGCEVMEQALGKAEFANHIWAVDYKGWFRTGDGTRCDPLTVSDLYSRCVLEVKIMHRPKLEGVKRVFEELFKNKGLPHKIRCDNGVPFGAAGAGGLSRLNVWWLQLGIEVEHIRPGKPSENGCHERMHKTLKGDTLESVAKTLRAQQRQTDEWIKEFNEERPHEGLGQRRPIEFYEASRRKYCKKLREVKYAPDMEVRRVRSNGEIKWLGRKRYIGEAFIRQVVGLRRKADEVYEVYYTNRYLGDLWTDDPGGIRQCKIIRRGVKVATTMTPDSKSDFVAPPAPKSNLLRGEETVPFS